ncbi:ABC transporter ATP-binding protein [Thermogladius sp. 4427co]|uniref:ABC transporter ATP-binding protein n=1 Tax=Thermogladius sp. 4427co TaxID=3450718 RepID=UPI003F79ACA9
MRKITKRFPGSIALDNVSVDFYEGTIHAVLGENGAGKSTLVKILSGIYTPDEGAIYVKGKRVTIESPMKAISLGIAMVSQSPVLIDRLTVAENLILGLRKYGVFSSPKKVEKTFAEIAQKIGIKVDPNEEVWKLSYTQKQLVEISRALILNSKAIILDEALTYLPLEERRKFYKYLKEFVAGGGLVILITHKIPEAFEVASKITVLRRGKLVNTVDTNNITMDSVREMMFGERAKEISYERLMDGTPLEPILEVSDLWVKNDFGTYALKGVSFTVRRGEVLGIAGVIGNGQTELVQALFGLRPIERGSIRITVNGRTYVRPSTLQLRKLGAGYIPDQPLSHGVTIDYGMNENIAIIPGYTGPIINWARLEKLSKKFIEDLAIVTPGSKTPLKFLSGGNLMKTLVAREIDTAKNLLISFNPTRGLDEVTSVKVRKLIKEKVVRDKIGVLMVSEDLDEIFQVSDRIAVLNDGKIVGLFDAKTADRGEVERLMVM